MISQHTKMTPRFRFIDLFAGIGGFRIAFESCHGLCIFSSEYDKYAQLTYEAFFNDRPEGDITSIEPSSIPDHDILAAGFPCQPFSLAGVSKKQSLGRPHGFSDPTQGTLFFNIKEILKSKQTPAFILENVKNLRSHDGGKTFAIIMKTLVDELGYVVTEPRIIDASSWVPQHRERIFIVGFHPAKTGIEDSKAFQFPEPPCKRVWELNEIIEENVDQKYVLGNGTWETLLRHKRNHEALGQGFGYSVIDPNVTEVTRTLSARYHKDGAEILIKRGTRSRPRRLTPLECARLQGFPKQYQKFFDPCQLRSVQPVSDTQAYRQFGNSVAVPLVKAIAKQIVSALSKSGYLTNQDELQ